MTRGGGVVAVLAVVVLAGCTSPAAKPSTLPPVAASPSRSPSPSPSPSPAPHGTDVQQIVALSRDYYEETNRAVRTGNTARLRSLSTSTCQCIALALNIERIWKAGGAISPKYFTIREVARPTVTSSTAGFSSVIYKRNKTVYLDKAGHPIETFPPDTRWQSDSLDFVKIDGVWKVSLVSRNTN